MTASPAAASADQPESCSDVIGMGDAVDLTGPLKGRSWVEVWYRVRTGLDDNARALRTGSLLVAATTEVGAVQACVDALHDNDPACDPRLDPHVECVGSFTISPEEAEGWLGERDHDLADIAGRLDRIPDRDALVLGVRTSAVVVTTRPPRRTSRSRAT